MYEFSLKIFVFLVFLVKYNTLMDILKNLYYQDFFFWTKSHLILFFKMPCLSTKDDL